MNDLSDYIETLSYAVNAITVYRNVVIKITTRDYPTPAPCGANLTYPGREPESIGVHMSRWESILLSARDAIDRKLDKEAGAKMEGERFE